MNLCKRKSSPYQQSSEDSLLIEVIKEFSRLVVASSTYFIEQDS